MLQSIFTWVVCWQLTAAPPPRKVVLIGPVGSTVVHGDSATALLRQALANNGNVALRALPGSETRSPEAVEAVRSLLRTGEDAYMTFKFAPAAAALAEAAGQLTAIIGQLGPEELQLLQRARLLEGAAWAEAHHPELAMRAFADLLVIMPGTAVDASLLSPKTQSLWNSAQSRVRSHGTSTLRVTSTPAGAEVYLDGQPRGETPLNVTDLPVGTHYLTVRMPGYTTANQTLNLSQSRVQQEVALQETSIASSIRRLAQAARPDRNGKIDVADDVNALEQASGADEAIVVAQVAPYLVFSHWKGNEQQGVVIYTDLRDIDAIEKLTQRAMQGLLDPQDSPLYLPKAPTSPSNLEESSLTGAPPASGPTGSSFLALWLGMGNGALEGFSPEYRLQIGGGWDVGANTSIDLQLEGAHSAYGNQAALDFVGGTFGVRGLIDVGRFTFSGGGTLGADVALQHGNSLSLTAQFVPSLGAVVRIDFSITPVLFLGVQGTVRVTALRTTNAESVTSWNWPVRGYGFVGIGMRL